MAKQFGPLISQEKYAVGYIHSDNDVYSSLITPERFLVPVLLLDEDSTASFGTMEKSRLASYIDEIQPKPLYQCVDWPSADESYFAYLILSGESSADSGFHPYIGRVPAIINSGYLGAYLYYTDGTDTYKSVKEGPSTFPTHSRFYMVESNGEYNIYGLMPVSNYNSEIEFPFDAGKTPLYKTNGIRFIGNPNEPDRIEDIDDLIIKPILPYVGRGGSQTFEAFYRYKDGSEVQAKDVEWYLRTEAGDKVSSIDGIILSSLGSLVTSENTTLDRITVVAKSESLGYVASTDVFIDWTYNPGDPVSPGTVPNPGNQYFPGGISGASGKPGGTYDRTFGPNTSTLIPGVDAVGNGVMGGIGAAGNDIAKSGMYTKYLCDQNFLNLIAQVFWEDNVGIQFYKLIFGNPINAAISLLSYPFDIAPLVPTVQQNIFFGKYDSGLSATAITRSSAQIDWGTIPIDFYWGNFLDYAPHTQIQLYLPWGTGFVSIDPNEVMPYPENPVDYNSANFKRGSIRVITNIELDKGSCVHNVIGNRGLVIGSYGGIVGKQVPLAASDQSAKTLALLGAAVSVGTAAGNAIGAATGAKYTNLTPIYHRVGPGTGTKVFTGFEKSFDAQQVMVDLGNSKAMKAALASAVALGHTPPNYPRAGTFSDATSAMTSQKPYIIISRPSQSVPENYGHYNGYPSNIYYKKLSLVSGYTEISEIHLDTLPGTIEELEELDSMLKGGVLL